MNDAAASKPRCPTQRQFEILMILGGGSVLLTGRKREVDPMMLEGQMFDGLNVHRPRLFETNWPLDVPLLRPAPPRQTKMGRPPVPGEAMQVIGHFSDVPAGGRAMGIDWMMQGELAQAIPPAYTELIGHQLLAHIRASVPA